MKLHLYAFTIFISVNFLYSQKLNTKGWSRTELTTLDNANTLFSSGRNASAFEKYNSLLVTHPGDSYLKYKMGVCGVNLSDKYTEAINFLEDVSAGNNKAPDVNYYLALLFHKTYQFDKSIETANKLLGDSKTGSERKAVLNRLVSCCKVAKTLIENKTDFIIDNLGSPPNSEADEYSPVITADEEKLIFTYRGKESLGGLMNSYNISDPSGEYNEDVFMSKKKDGKWQKPEGITSVNTIDNDAAIALSYDQKFLFLYKYDKKGKGDIYQCEFDGEKFGKPEPLKGEVNTDYWEGGLSISTDQRIIYFASDRPGGFGGTDIYIAHKMADGSWGKVKNLGDKINSNLDEDSPFLHPDGRTLVFSSQGHNTMGGFDIFTSDLDELDSSWKAPVNLGYPINTPENDLCYVLSADGKRGYYASNKKGGYGGQDLYVAEPGIATKKTYLTVIKGKVTENLAPMEADIFVSVSDDNNRKYTLVKSNPESGNYLLSLPSGHNYKITFYHEVFGDKTFDIVAEKVDGYAEKKLYVNFGMSDTSSSNQSTVVISNNPVEPTSTLTALTSTTIVSDKNVTNLSDEQIILKYGAVKVDGLKFVIQLGAHRHPENYHPEFLQKICKTKYSEAVKGVTLIIADKEFDNLNDAVSLLKKVRAAGQTDAFITGSLQGNRYYLKELLKKSVWTTQ